MKRILMILLGCVWMVCYAYAEVSDHVVITGVVKAKESREELSNVNVMVVGTNIGTVTNADGEFSIKVSRAEMSNGLSISHLGFLNAFLSAEEIIKNNYKVTIWMVPSTVRLSELVIFGGHPQELVESAIRKIPQNYSEHENLFSAFYRETIQKGRRYIGVSEAVMDVYKTGYGLRDPNRDKVQLLKGRRLVSQRKSDTLAIKVVGGPSISVYLDVAKNASELLDLKTLHFYEFTLELPASIDNRMQHVVSFRPRVSVEYALYQGKLYIDQQSLTFTRADFELDMSDRDKVVRSILHNKPAGLRFRPQGVSVLVTYRQQGEKTYLNYVRNVIRFKCDWKKRLFSSTYTATSEMVMVDRDDHPAEKIKQKEAFGRKEVFYDSVIEYWDEDFWKEYNIIEPTESLESAVNKLKKKLDND